MMDWGPLFKAGQAGRNRTVSGHMGAAGAASDERQTR